jgi:SNF2 family DNA or RNA helicase
MMGKIWPTREQIYAAKSILPVETDRAHRIGQRKSVFVYQLIAADTVEERIIELQDKKGRLAAATLDRGAAVGSFAIEDLDYLFGD